MRVREQPLQSACFAVAFFSDCLCNTHLQSSDLLPNGDPIKGFPIVAFGRGRTNRTVRADRHLLFLREEDSIDSCKERPDRRGRIRSITERPWLVRSSPCRLPWVGLAVDF